MPGYLYVASRNRVFNLIEKGKTRTDYLSSVARYTEEASMDTIHKLDERELMGIIVLEIAKLPPKMRKADDRKEVSDQPVFGEIELTTVCSMMQNFEIQHRILTNDTNI